MPERRLKVTDDEIFAATQRAMTRRGPHELTLAHIAVEAGVSPGRLVQRFGSKRALLLALAERFAGSAAIVFAGLRAAHRRPLAALRAYATCMADLAATPDALSRNLAYLQIDLTDPEFVWRSNRCFALPSWRAWCGRTPTRPGSPGPSRR
jgi:AcrR family transcriptional regulator